MKYLAQFVCVVVVILCCAILTDSATASSTKQPAVPGTTSGSVKSPEKDSDTKSKLVKDGSTKPETASGSNNLTSHSNMTVPMLNGTLPDSWYGKNRGMLQRTVYVVLGVTAIVVIYFGVRAWRTRRRQSKSRKYGLISTGADLEMEPLGNDMDDDDDDMTVFEQNGRRK